MEPRLKPSLFVLLADVSAAAKHALIRTPLTSTVQEPSMNRINHTRGRRR